MEQPRRSTLKSNNVTFECPTCAENKATAARLRKARNDVQDELNAALDRAATDELQKALEQSHLDVQRYRARYCDSDGQLAAQTQINEELSEQLRMMERDASKMRAEIATLRLANEKLRNPNARG